MKEIDMEWDEWVAKFRPIKNTFSKDPDELMFETFGEEVDFVKRQNEHNIWTYIDVEMGTAIYNGWHFVNRIGYYITEVPWEDSEYYEVDLQIDTCEICGEPNESACIEDDGELTCYKCCKHEECNIEQ